MIRTSVLKAWWDHLFGGRAVQFFFAKFQKKICVEYLRIYGTSLPWHNANVQKFVSLMFTQWTDTRNNLNIDSVKSLVLVKYYYKNYNFNFSDFFFFNWLFIVALTARSYRDCHWFSAVWEFVLWYFEPQQSQMRFFLIHDRHLLGRVQCSHPRREQPWVQATLSIMRDICRAVSNVVTGPRPSPI